MRKIYLIAIFAIMLSSRLSAQVEGPRLVLSATLSNPAPHHGEHVRMEVTIRNEGPGDVRNGSFDIDLEGATLRGEVSEPLCSGAELTSTVRCTFPAVAANASARYAFDLRMSNSAAMYFVRGSVFTYTYGSTMSRQVLNPDVSFEMEGPIATAASRSDVLVTQAFDPDPVRLGSQVRITTKVSNLGPDPARDVSVAIRLPFVGRTTSLSGADCHFDDRHFVCSIGMLLAGEQREIVVDFDAPGIPESHRISAYATFRDGTDQNGANNSSERGFQIGFADVGTVLLPLISPPAAGVSGTTWVTEAAAFLDGEPSAFLFPLSNNCRILCPVIATKMLTPGLVAELEIPASSDFPGYLLRFDRRRETDLSFINRVRETSRVNDEWGIDVPVVFDEDFLRGPIQILGVAGFERYRRTLRIYQPDALPSTVTVRLYKGGYQEELAAEARVTLRQPDASVMFNGLPIRASYAQLNLDKLYSGVRGVRSVRVEIVPDSPELRHWAFVSITDNTTQEVRLAVPHQRPEPWSPID